MADRDTIKLELPAWVRSFKFTFECRKLGPMAIDVSMREPLDLELPSGTACCADASETPTMKPGVLTDWLEDQTAAEARVIDDNETEPESEPPAENTKCLVDDPAKCAGPVPDNSEMEPESEPEAQTPVEFTIWYEANKDVRIFILYYDY
ncbi:hypothetical protein DFJ58DRAFT_723630 [Suillus subalutaceus]|uniref:uncharacterized protein n=1 Tax=Suillus subalutaceus TaxID=48586 RepID=UPI001B875B6B|nr:uncharacterized protein DFJ58DRAFT_723630 [Suillus subalutaceus]KAG1868373.1 hypothetical protein DFJ58DRAFT_723630 [Suillus subalutaceus]